MVERLVKSVATGSAPSLRRVGEARAAKMGRRDLADQLADSGRGPLAGRRLRCGQGPGRAKGGYGPAGARKVEGAARIRGRSFRRATRAPRGRHGRWRSASFLLGRQEAGGR